MRTIRARGILALVVSALGVGIIAGADSPGLKSGLPVGEPVPAFLVDDITGPNKGKTLCYR